MKFEEEFPSLTKLPDVIKCGAVILEDIQEHCLDKQREFHINEDEFSKLICEGKVTTHDGLKLDATTESTFGELADEYFLNSKLMQKLKEEHLLVAKYKQRVLEAIDKVFNTDNSLIAARQTGKTLMVHWTVHKKVELLKELNLQ